VNPRGAAGVPVWIDADAAIGVPRADVDDGLALIQAFHSPELEVRGVSAVFGNAPLEKTWPIAREITERFGPAGLAVRAGAAGAAALGEPTEAVRALAQALRDEPLVVLALGPATNVATLLMLHPELAARIRSVVLVAGRRRGQAFRSVAAQPIPFPDFNFECDPPAVRILLESGVDLVFTPWEVSSHVWLDREDLARLETSGAPGAYIAKHARPWLEIWEKELGAPGFNPFDTLAVAWATHPELLEWLEVGVHIDRGPSDTASTEERAAGRTKPLLIAEPGRDAPQRRALYCTRPHAAFKPLLLERLAGPARTPGSHRR
jgi:inosine-uridine nucleoside N-ribohydrolase